MPRSSPLASRVGDRRSRRAAALAAAAVLACTLTACTPPAAGDPAPSDAPAATSSAAPIFASDEEALAAAVAAYEAYRAVSSSITADGGASPERITDVVSPNLADRYIEEFNALRDGGLRTEGESRVFGARLAERSESGASELVSAYLCRDVSDVKILNSAGQDVTPPDRSPIAAVYAQFKPTDVGENDLILVELEPWSDDSFCNQ